MAETSPPRSTLNGRVAWALSGELGITALRPPCGITFGMDRGEIQARDQASPANRQASPANRQASPAKDPASLAKERTSPSSGFGFPISPLGMFPVSGAGRNTNLPRTMIRAAGMEMVT